MFESFQHYLSYGSTDQQTIRELSRDFNGLVVPGTIAAFQADGTKGFVLSLSARSNQPYVIDSRFPLFQNHLSRPKKSHGMLADILGVPSLINQHSMPEPANINQDQIACIAKSWIDFNTAFDEISTKTFDKYAARLNEPVVEADREEPTYILPPYVMVNGLDDGWMNVDDQLWKSSCRYADEKGVRRKLHRVLAARTAGTWDDLAARVEEPRIVAWVSNLNEFSPEAAEELTRYGQALQHCKARGQKVFALYGGFLSVLFSRYGLTGSSHGIGFSEHRDWVELPSSGQPPARYYMPRLHRYVSVETAELIWRSAPDFMSCHCLECNGGSPQGLDYHALMKHSVRVRSSEIESWLSLPTDQVVERLLADYQLVTGIVRRMHAPTKVIQRAMDNCDHLPLWAGILRRLG